MHLINVHTLTFSGIGLLFAVAFILRLKITPTVEVNKRVWLFLVLFLIAFVVAGSGIFYAYQHSKLWGIGYFAAYAIACLLILINTIDLDFIDDNLWALPTFFVAGGLSMFSLVIAIPVAIIPRFEVAPLSNSQYMPTLESFDSSFINISQRFSDFEAAIVKERSSLEGSFNQLKFEVIELEAAIGALQTERDHAKKEADQYKTLMSLTKKQVEGIKHMLSKGRYNDYIIGFLVGIFSSGIVAVATQLVIGRTLLKKH